MARTHKERILDYLWSIAPEEATNGQIRAATGITSHQQVYLLTQELMYRGYIRGEQRGSGWVFWADESLAARFTSPGRASPKEIAPQSGQRLAPQAFEELARQKMRSRSEIVRVAVRDYVNRKLELIEIQKLAAKRYAEGKLSMDELVDILGFNEAKKVAHYKDLAESSFAQGMS